MKKLIIIAAAFWGISTMANAQTVITDETMTHDSDSVTVTFNIDTEQTKLKTNRKELIFPYIYNEKDTLFLDVVEVYGKGRFKRERQINAINGDRNWGLGENQVFRHDGVYTYESKVPLKRWMKVANLGVRRTIVGCACEDELKDENLAQANLFEEPQVQRRLPAYALGEVERKWDFGQDELEITFKVSKAEIDSKVFNNEVTFGKILNAIDKIHNNPNFKVSKLHVAGYASPEGSLSFNKWLGINRAKALINFIIKNRPEYGLTEENFEILNGEENWVGLRRVLAESELSQKDRVIEIIDNTKLSGEAKKRSIKDIDGGKTWDEMLKKIYPHLRSARYLAVYYDNTEDEIADLIKKANEMIEDGRYSEAYDSLIKHQDDLRTANTIGVSLMMQKKFEEAMPWLEKALQSNSTAAQKNIDSINQEYKWEEQQRKEIEEYLKKYE
jgi:hypothetical protein